jgi:hypothetical protein
VEQRPRVFKNTVLRKIFGPNRDKIWRRMHEEIHDLYSLTQYYVGDYEECDGRSKWHVWGRREVHTRFWRETLTERDHSSYLRINTRIILKQTVKKSAGVERRGMD